MLVSNIWLSVQFVGVSLTNDNISYRRIVSMLFSQDFLAPIVILVSGRTSAHRLYFLRWREKMLWISINNFMSVNYAFLCVSISSLSDLAASWIRVVCQKYELSFEWMGIRSPYIFLCIYRNSCSRVRLEVVLVDQSHYIARRARGDVLICC